MVQFLQFTVNGLTVAAVYSLIALGLSLIFNVSRVLNLAQGSFYTLAAFIAYTMLQFSLPFWLAMIISVGLVTLIGLIFERWVVSPASAGANISILLMLTLGLSMILEGLMKLIWGTDPVVLPSITSGNVRFLGVSILQQNLWIIAGTIVILLALYLFFRYTYIGKSMTAVAENPLAAGIMGINAGLVRAVAFGISAFVGALGGIIASPVTLVAFDSSTMIGLKGFIAAVVGGVGNLFGGVIGAIVLALSEAYSSGYLSSLFMDTISFLILILVLVIRSFRKPAAETGSTIGKYHAPLTTALRTRGKIILAVLTLAAIVFPLTINNSYVLGIVIVMLIFMVAVIGLDLLHGFTGVLSLGQAGFMAVSGYTAAILMRDFGVPPLLAMIIAIVVSMLVAWVLAVSTIRLTGYNIAIATLGFSIIMESIATGWRSLTGGSAGFTGIPNFSIGSWSFSSDRSIYYLVLFFLIIGFWLAYNLTRSQTGRVLKSIQQDSFASQSMGVAINRYRTKVFVLSSAYAGLAGVLYAHYMNFLSPGMVGMDTSIQLLVMLTLGGAGSLWGLIPGVAILSLIPEVFKSIANYQIIIEGLILIVILMFFKGGLWSLGGKLMSMLRTSAKDQKKGGDVDAS